MARRALADQDVTIFEDGSVVLERIANGQLPEVLVLDTQLLGVSGLDVCRAVREHYSSTDLPILMVTVQSGQADVLEALRAGANDYVTKPYHVAELAARVATLVRTSKLVAAQNVAHAADRARRRGRRRADGGAHDRRGRAARRRGDREGPRADPDRGVGEASGEHDARARRHERGARDSRRPRRRVLPPRRSGVGRSAVALPLVVRGEVVGAVCAAPHDPDAVVELVGSVTHLLALGLARALAEEERLVLLDRERNARGEAEAANRSKDDFLATVSHELRTPLNAITGWTSMLLSGGLDAARTRRAYETIDRNARSQAQLIDDLLDIGRITSGTLRLEESQIEIGSIAEMALESLRPTAEQRGVAVVANIAPDLGESKGDATRIQQVIWNLMSNAIKFTPRGGHVRLDIVREARGVVIAVKDDGQGIDPSFLPRVFDRFRQQDGSSTRSRGGLGLGLSIVRHLVELHGGTIDVESEGEGKGATFHGRPARSMSDRCAAVRPTASSVQPSLRRSIARARWRASACSCSTTSPTRVSCSGRCSRAARSKS